MTRPIVAQPHGNVTAFPAPDREWEIAAFRALRDLEAPLADLEQMIGIASDVAEDLLQIKNGKQIGDTEYREYGLHDRAIGRLIFSIYHASEMAQSVLAAYYAALERDQAQPA